jgi:hypothetical protein
VVLGRGIFALAALALWVYCVFDVIRTDQSNIQNLPKMAWLMIVILVPPIGPIAWLLLGRPRGTSFRLSSTEYRPDAPPAPREQQGFPERQIPDADYQRRREEAIRRHQEEREEELKAREEELKRLEEELRRREQGLGDPDK